MGHKTLIGGTSYEIGGGKTMVGGTAYSIDKGKTMSNGTVYEIAFKPSKITVNISGKGQGTLCCAVINGTRYSSATTLELEAGTSIEIVSSSSSSTGRRNSKVYLNGTLVASGTTSGASYTFTPDAATVNITLSYNTTSVGSSVNITTS